MSRRGLCVRAFPRSWRRRYGDELLALLAQDTGRAWSADLDLLRAGLRERVRGMRPVAPARSVGLASAVCAIVALAPGAIAPATSTPRAHPTALAAVTVLETVPRHADVVRPVTVRSRGRAPVTVVAPVRTVPPRVRVVAAPARVAARVRH